MVVRGRPCSLHLLAWSGSQSWDGALDGPQVSSPTDVTEPQDMMSVLRDGQDLRVMYLEGSCFVNGCKVKRQMDVK